jgi:hypothetical protein
MLKRFLVALLAVVLAGVVMPAAVGAQAPDYLYQWGTYGAGDGQFSTPIGVTVYVSDRGNHRIQKFTSDGTFLTKWGTQGSGDGQFNLPFGVAVDASGNVYVAEYGNNRIQRFTGDGTYLTQWGSLGTGDGQLSGPIGVAVDANGNVYVAEYLNRRIQKFTSDGTYLTRWGLYVPFSVAVDGSGNVYVIGRDTNRIQKFTSDGTYLTQWGASGSGNGQFANPYGGAVDGRGNVYVADTGNNRIQVFGSPMPTQPTTVDFSGISSALVASPDGQEFTYVLGSGPTTGILNVRLVSGDATGGITTGASPDPNGIYILQLPGALTPALLRFTFDQPRGFQITSNETLTAHETNTSSFVSGGSPWQVLSSSDATVNNTGTQVTFVGVNDSPPYGQFAVSAAAGSFDFLVSNAPDWPIYGSALSLVVVDRPVPAVRISIGQLKAKYAK